MSVTREQPTTNLFLLDELEEVGRTSKLADGDLDALRVVSNWITTFVAKHHKDLGRAGPVCPFVPGALERNTLWLAPVQIADQGVADVVDLVSSYQRLFLGAQPADGDDVIYKSIVLVFTDLPADRAGEFFDDVLKDLAVPSYVQDEFVMGGFYEGNEGTAIYNSSFRPFTSPVPFLLIRQAVISDWKFFLDDEAWLKRWVQGYGGPGAQALAGELRRLPWRTQRD